MGTIGERLKQVRKAQPDKPSQEEFAGAMGITRAAYMYYEQDKVVPTPATLKLICMTYNVNPRWLETGEGEPFVELPEDGVASAVRALLPHESEFAVATIAALAQMPQEWWDKFEEAVEREKAKMKG